MQFQVPIWPTTYPHDRREHRHRCRCCSRIIEAGEQVLMARVKAKTTWAIHEACAHKRHSDAYTWGEVMKLWAFNYQIKVFGLSETRQSDWSKIAKYRAETGTPAAA